jgi:hypothetical protein
MKQIRDRQRIVILVKVASCSRGEFPQSVQSWTEYRFCACILVEDTGINC